MTPPGGMGGMGGGMDLSKLRALGAGKLPGDGGAPGGLPGLPGSFPGLGSNFPGLPGLPKKK